MGKTTTAKATTSIEDDADFVKFISMYDVTSDQKYADLSDEKQRGVQNKFFIWKDKGMPKAEMPLLETKEDVIIKVFREKVYGKQYIYYQTPKGNNVVDVGRDHIHTYAQIEEFDEKGKPTGKTEDDLKHIIKTETKLLTPYTKALGEKYMAQAFKTWKNPTFYFRTGKATILVDDPEKDFNGDFDDYVRFVYTSRKRQA